MEEGLRRASMIKHHSQNAGKHYRDGKSGQPKIRFQHSLMHGGERDSRVGGQCQKILGSTARACLQVCPAQARGTRPVKPKLCAVNHRQQSRAGGWWSGGYADPTGCQQTTGKWMPEKAITMINLVRRFSN